MSSTLLLVNVIILLVYIINLEYKTHLYNKRERCLIGIIDELARNMDLQKFSERLKEENGELEEERSKVKWDY